MNAVQPRGRPGLAALELGLLVLLAWLAFGAITLLPGSMGISWDMLNHHVYLGWSANAPRFHLDILPASYQTYQFPYLYWPLYKLALGGASGAQAGFALATLHLLAVPPVWLMARVCIPEASWFGAFMRSLGVILAFLSGVVLSLMDSTANDLLSATPYLWALALSLGLAAGAPAPESTRRRAVIAGALGGVAVALKLSNGPLVLLLPLLWAIAPGTPRQRLTAVAAGCVAVLVGFALTYGYWGWQLWTHFGNPFFPIGDAWFEPVRSALGWRP